MMHPESAIIGSKESLTMIKRFVQNSKGSIALSFALTLPVLVVGAGTAVDYSMASQLKTATQSSSDAGVLAASRMMIVSKDQFKAEQEGRAVFTANLEQMDSRATIDEFKISLMEANPPKFSITAKTSKKRMMSFMQDGPMQVAVTSEAEAKMKQTDVAFTVESPTEIVIAADTSGSMGMAANAASRDRLVAATTAEQVRLGLGAYYGGCAFACHDVWSGTGHQISFLDLARANNVLIRMDVSKNAMRIISNRTLSDPTKGHRVSLVEFHGSIRQVQELSSSRSVVNNAIDTLDFTSYASDFKTTLPALGAFLASQATGTTMRKDAAKAVILLTDGMQYDGTISAIKPEVCAALKSSQITVAILELKYMKGLFPNPEHVWHKIETEANIPLIEPALKSCVSDPSLYANATEPLEVENAIGHLLTKVMQVAQKPVLTR
jgi:Flp pilus assembly protein TadG